MLVPMSENQTSETQAAQAAAQPAEAPRSTNFRTWLPLIAIGGAILILDQAVKYLVSTRLLVGQSWAPIPALAPFIRITYSENAGAAFGMLPQLSDVFLALALITVIAFIISYPRLPSHATLSRLSIGLISGGALSNALDRVRFNYVIDYVHVQLTPTYANISNFGDHAITVGVILLLIDQWLADRQHDSTVQEADSEPSDAPS